MQARLTQRAVQAARPGARREVLWDGVLPGFGLKVETSGRKVFILQYRLPGKPTRRYTIGAFGDLTLEQARAQAGALRAEIAQRLDPARTRMEAQSSPMMQDLADRFLREHSEVKKKAGGIRTDTQIWKTYVLPELKNLRVGEVTRDDIARLHFRMRAIPYQANRTLALLSKAFNLAERWGWRPSYSNPVRGIDRYREIARDRLLLTEELERLGQALAAAESSGSEDPWALAAIRLLMHTGCRRAEILLLKWEEVDLEHRILRLKDSKTGKRFVPLSDAAVEVLRGIEPIRDNPYVIRGFREGKALNGIYRIWHRLRSEAQLPDLRLHDLRHHFASLGAASGLSLPTIGAILGHKSPATTMRYLHWQNHPLLAAVDQLGGTIQRAVERGAARANEEQSETAVN